MANEITHAALQSTGGQLAAFLSPLLKEQLYDPTDLRVVCPFVPFDGSASDTMDVTLDAVPGAAAAATNETTGGQSNAAYTTSKYSLAIARYVRQYSWGDLPGIAGGPFNLAVILANLVKGVSLTYTDMITALFASFTSEVGTTTVDLDVDDIYDGQFTLNTANVPNTADAPIQVVLHNVQINNFQASLRGEAGAVQFEASTNDMLGAGSPGFRGRWNGMNFWQSDSVPLVTTSADRGGAMFGQGAIEWTYGPIAGVLPSLNPGDVLFSTDEIFIERNRDATNALTVPVLNLYPAVAVREVARGVEVITDA